VLRRFSGKPDLRDFLSEYPELSSYPKQCGGNLLRHRADGPAVWISPRRKVMKCDLCRDKRMASSLLCVSCGEMIRRLIDIVNRLSVREVCVAERLSAETAAQHNAAANQA
jgi:hypothetical protein